MRHTQDLACHGIDPDDGPPRRTVPETITPNERFMEAAPHGRWDVFDWAGEACEKCGGSGGGPDPALKCPCCGGTGEGGLSPELVAAGLDEADARLLAFGGGLLGVARAVLGLYDEARVTGRAQTLAGPLIDAMRAALARAEGGAPDAANPPEDGPPS